MHRPLPRPPTDDSTRPSEPSSPRPSEAPATVLDATAFPHILDRVLAYLAPEHLYPLRAVSRDVQRRIDTQITCFRVVLVDHRWRCLQRCVPPVGAVPLRSDGVGREYCVQDLPPDTLVKVVQVRRTADGVADALDTMGTVHTVQRCGAKAVIHPGVRTMVDCFGFANLGTPTLFWKVAGSHAEKRYHQPTIPDSIRRYVLHAVIDQVASVISVDEDDHDVRFAFPPGLCEFVLVLWPIFATEERRRVQDVPVSLVSMIGAAVTAAESDIKTTIVGAERLSPLVLGNNKEKFADPADAVEAVRELLRTHQTTKFRAEQQRYAEAQAFLQQMNDDNLACVQLAKRQRVGEISRRDPLINDMRRRVMDHWRTLGKPDLRTAAECKDPFSRVDKEPDDLYDMQRKLEGLISYHRRNTGVVEPPLPGIPVPPDADKLSPVRFLTLQEWWRDLGPTRRRYQGLAFDDGRADGDEALSLSLVEMSGYSLRES
ncbi:uncharacterized protein LOC62_04G005245 [Vanrija pseudolonga]|uniref:F-box domain-containing protein n=1 Tax=Vanrija pseudolonga TaxID=143232 RepID=A0AAF0YBH2_9TREE|nr:hypothetical protein LOC62_04G005245 [Vanrija pseudolonga]